MRSGRQHPGSNESFNSDLAVAADGIPSPGGGRCQSIAGQQKRFLHYYAPRTGKTFVQAALAFWLMKGISTSADCAYEWDKKHTEARLASGCCGAVMAMGRLRGRRLLPAWCCYALALATQLSAAGVDVGMGSAPLRFICIRQPEGATGQCVQLLEADLCIDLSPAVRDLPTLTSFLEEYEANVVDGTGQTVLHWAASAGKPEAIDFTLDQGALVDKLDRDGRSPLHIAALSGHTEAVQLLLARRADPAVGDGSGSTPLHRAALAGAAGCVAVLAQSAPGQLDVAQRRTGGTALHAAAYLGHVNVIEELWASGATAAIAATWEKYQRCASTDTGKM
eukprot:s1410_g4.t1